MTAKAGNGTESGVSSVIRTFRILETIAKHGRIGLSDLSRELRIHKSTVLRFLSTLCDRGYIRRLADSDSYALTLKLFELGATALDQMDVVEQARPVMEWLAGETNETVHLATRESDSVVYLHKIDSSHALRMYSRIGKLAPLHCTGLGKALLAWLPEPTVREIYSRLKLTVYTENTISRVGELLEELARIRSRGYSWDHEEHEPGIRCVAVPIFDRSGEVCAALSISWPSVRDRADTERKRAPLAMEASQRITASIGGTLPSPQSASPTNHRHRAKSKA